MTTLNIAVTVTDENAVALFSALASVLGGTPTVADATPEKAVKPKAAAPEKSVKGKTAAPVVPDPKSEAKEAEPEDEEPRYTIEALRAKAKEAAINKGNNFVAAALKAVGAESISNIAPGKYNVFMDILTGVKND